MMGCKSCKNTLAKKCVPGKKMVPGNLRGVDLIPQMKPTYFLDKHVMKYAGSQFTSRSETDINE